MPFLASCLSTTPAFLQDAVGWKMANSPTSAARFIKLLYRGHSAFTPCWVAFEHFLDLDNNSPATWNSFGFPVPLFGITTSPGPTISWHVTLEVTSPTNQTISLQWSLKWRTKKAERKQSKKDRGKDFLIFLPSPDIDN